MGDLAQTGDQKCLIVLTHFAGSAAARVVNLSGGSRAWLDVHFA